MRKIYLVIILLFVSFLHLTESVFAQKTVFYDSSQDFYSSKTELSENYSCNLDELEELSTSLFMQKKFTDLVIVYDKCIKTYPNNPNLYNNRANIYKMLKRYDLALVDYEKAISLDKNYKSPYLGKASLFVVTSKEDEAIEILDGIIKKYRNEASAYYYKGLALFFKNDKENALKNFTLAIKYAKDTITSAYYYRGNLYAFYKEDYKKALADYTKCINIAKKNSINHIHLISSAEVYENRAIAYYKLGDYNNMIKDFLQAIVLYEQEGDIEKAKEIRELLSEEYLSKWIIIDDETHIQRESIESFNTDDKIGKDVFYIYYSKDIKTPSNIEVFKMAEKNLKSDVTYITRYVIINATQKKYANKSVTLLDENGKLVEEKVFDNDKLIWRKFAPNSKIAKILERIIEELKK